MRGHHLKHITVVILIGIGLFLIKTLKTPQDHDVKLRSNNWNALWQNSLNNSYTLTYNTVEFNEKSWFTLPKPDCISDRKFFDCVRGGTYFKLQQISVAKPTPPLLRKF